MANNKFLPALFTDAKTFIIRRFNPEYGVDSVPNSDIRDIYGLYTDEFSALTSQNIKWYIESARLGLPFYMYALLDSIRQKDLVISGILTRRRLAVLGEEWVIDGNDDEPGMKEAKEYVNFLMKKIKKHLGKFMSDVVEANIQGIKKFEINWEIDAENKIYPKEINDIDNKLYLFDDTTNEHSIMDATKVTGSDILSWSAEASSGDIKISQIPKVNIHPMKLLQVNGLDRNSKRDFMNGMTIAFILGYYVKSYLIKDMAMFIERFASPKLKGKYNPFNAESKKQMKAAVENQKAFGAIIYPGDSDVDYLNDQQKGAAFQIFNQAIEYFDKCFIRRAVGEEETTQMGSQGSRAALEVKKEISKFFSIADLLLIEIAINDIIQRGLSLSFNNNKATPEFKFIKVKTLEDKKTLSEIFSSVKSSGFSIAKDTVEEQLGIVLQEIEETDETKLPPPKKEAVKAEDLAYDYVNDIWEKRKNKN